jgi:hypothetical protein
LIRDDDSLVEWIVVITAAIVVADYKYLAVDSCTGFE